MSDDLARFVTAQEATQAAARAELAAGRKTSHWMWWTFPQLRGLGRSHRTTLYGIADAAEAARYLAHPVLGPRLIELSGLMLAHAGRPPGDILGPVDARKLQSAMTLFAAVPGAPPVFARVLDAFYGGRRCTLTLDRLA